MGNYIDYYKNFESVFRTGRKAGIVHWTRHFDTALIDYKGFPKDLNIYETLYTEQEFLEYVSTSTARMSEKLVEALEKKK